MRYLRDKIVIVTGAGFSAPANLPIQDKILKEMTEPPEDSIMDYVIDKESEKFLSAYIQVAIYLLREYGTAVDVKKIAERYNRIKSIYRSNDRVLEIIDYISSNYNSKAEEKEFNLIDVLDSTGKRFYLEPDEYCNELMLLREELREKLQKSNIQICLEDIFTLFDKCITMKENTADYTYAEIDNLQNAILRLFTFYFSNKVNSHDYHKSDYLETIKYVNNHIGQVSVITTNWDILLEEYFRKNGIDFDYKFNSQYVIKSDGEVYPDTGSNTDSKVPYIKIHGSINWFRCLKCGTLQICDADTCGKYLFDDSEEEKCVQCGQTGVGDAVQIKPEIITPTMMKLLNNQLYNNLWQNAAYELQQADKVIFCGYSLPLADYEFRYLLKQNIQPGTEIDVVLYHNDDPARCRDDHMISFLPEKRYTDLFPNSKCRFYYEGFGEYFAGENKIWE